MKMAIHNNNNTIIRKITKKSSIAKLLSGKTKKISTATPKMLSAMQVVNITEKTDLTKYLPTLPLDMVKPKTWELHNRKSFYQWMYDNFGKYDTSDKANAALVIKEGMNPNPDRKIRQLFPVQKLVRDFMATESPYRGILLYFGLGVGKTLSALAVSEGILNKKKVIFMSKASLESNFISTVKLAGQDYMVNNNYWVFAELGSPEVEKMREELNIPKKIADENGGIYLIDFTVHKSNYDDLSQKHRDNLNMQLDALLKERFMFVHYDSPTLFRHITAEDFNDKVIIIDEVHNLTNGMTKANSKAAKLYEMFMNSKNSKFVFLTGTPVINQVFEAGCLFNVLRGYIQSLEFTIQVNFDMPIDFKKIKANLKQNKHIDQIVINQVNRKIKITKNPDHFITSNEPSNPGVVYTPNQPVVTLDQLQTDIEQVLKGLGYKFTVVTTKETCLPNNQEDFEKMFYNPDLNKLKKPEVFKKRIASLLSFYDYKDPQAFPELTAGSPHIIQCPMSDYQLGIYETVRHEEIQKDKKASRRKNDDEAMKSSYRLDSRLACSFVYPDDMPNPYGIKRQELMEQQIEAITDAGEEVDEIDTENEKSIVKFVKENIMKMLRKNRAKYFDIPSGALSRYSPKYVAMIKNIMRAPGLVLVYSYFKTMVGLNMFALALEQTGEWEEFQIKKIDKQWHLITGNPDMEGKRSHSSSNSGNGNNKAASKHEGKAIAKRKNCYVFYSGAEDKEYREIIKFVYNSEFDRLPQSCNPLKASLQKLYAGDENLHGQIIKMMMTTRTGAEGLDLKHVRSIHITEPYWQPVLLDQVIGRGVRNNSHIRLPLAERNVEVFIYMATISGHMLPKISQADVRVDFAKYNDGLGMKGRVVSSDEALYITSEHKRVITNQLLHLMKESAFDCSLKYAVNSKQHYDPQIVCMHYETKDRDEYLFTPSIDDTQDLIAVNQEVPVIEEYTPFDMGKFDKDGRLIMYYVSNVARPDGTYLIYDETIMTKVRNPKPIGIVVLTEGKKTYRFLPSEKAKWK
jgi:hypothetical protein